MLKRLLPDNLLLKPKTNGEIEIEDLNGMIGKLENRFCSLYNIQLVHLPSLSIYRKRLLNPLSHDDAHTPVYKAEIRGAMAEIDKIKEIAVCSRLGPWLTRHPAHSYLLSIVYYKGFKIAILLR